MADTVLGYDIATSGYPSDVLYLIQTSGDKQISLETLFGTISVPLKTSERVFLQGTAQSLNNAGTINNTATITVLSNDLDAAVTIADGSADGQIKVLLFETGVHTTTISGSNLFSSIVFNTPGQTKTLIWQGTHWWDLS